MMEGVARYKERFQTFGTFFEQAANGSLPHFSMLRGNNSNSDHPCYDVARGERLHKDIYEALRAGRGWNRTLFLIIYDDAGGFYDSVVPPSAPADESPCSVDPGCARTGAGPPFDFKRLGLRVAALLISPWIAPNSVFQRPAGPAADSEFALAGAMNTSKPEPTAQNRARVRTPFLNREYRTRCIKETAAAPPTPRQTRQDMYFQREGLVLSWRSGNDPGPSTTKETCCLRCLWHQQVLNALLSCFPSRLGPDVRVLHRQEPVRRRVAAERGTVGGGARRRGEHHAHVPCAGSAESCTRHTTSFKIALL